VALWEAIVRRLRLLQWAVPLLLSVYFSFNLNWAWLWGKTKYDHRRIGFRIFDWAFWWSCWEDEMSWRSKDPWWMRWSFNLRDFVLGLCKYEKVTLSKHRIWIPLPEGEYLAEAGLQVSTWRRRHWPWWPLTIRRLGTDVEVLQWGGLPFEGKGENSYDCGRDGLFGYSVDGHDLSKAIAMGVELTLRCRAKHGLSSRGAYPNPVIKKQGGLKAFAEYCARISKSEDKYPNCKRSTIEFELIADTVYVHLHREGRPQTIVTTRTMAERWARTLSVALSKVKVEPENDKVAEAT
jgi:hypothetical protein